jgi:hypothetical protein
MIIDGTNGLTFNNATTQASAGVVLQVIGATFSTQTSTTSTSYVATGLTLSITPKFSTSKILITGMINIQSPSNNDSYWTIYRNGSTLSTSASGFGIVEAGTQVMLNTQGISYLDSPATTSATTYAIYCKVGSGSTQFWCINGQPATLTALEIAG